MAFNFNWSPLAADTDFYKRAQEMLTAALNKSPKPPIIVDEILVHEMNLGSVPPDLEILEIGDLAEDKFRGIFKMRYSGDAFLTLKTRVQANPLNTYLSTRPSFGSPEPLAAASGLTIPLKITLSEIKLSAFIILVFSKQKGITLVFRNDPLEALKVSSTFDSISFVRDYLQKEIEGQLRTLLMDQVPAIIHRLSLRLFVPEFREKEDIELAKESDNSVTEETITDPLASPPQDPVDLNGNVLDPSQIASLSLDSSAEVHSLFSQKNLIRLASLTDSNRTLSLFSPSMRDVVYRAWAGHMECGDGTGFQSPMGAALSRKHSQVTANTAHTYTFSSAASDVGSPASHATRPSLASHSSSFTGSTFGKHSKPGRKRKHRTINLRKPKTHTEDRESVSEGSMSATMSSTASENGYPAMVPEEREAELVTPPPSPGKAYARSRRNAEDISLQDSHEKLADTTPRPSRSEKQTDSTRKPFQPLFEAGPSDADLTGAETFGRTLTDSTATIRPKPTRYFGSWQPPTDNGESISNSLQTRSTSSQKLAAPFPYSESNPGGILEQAWMMKMAGEIARRVTEQKASDAGFWDDGRDSTPPPAYAS